MLIRVPSRIRISFISFDSCRRHVKSPNLPLRFRAHTPRASDQTVLLWGDGANHCPTVSPGQLTWPPYVPVLCCSIKRERESSASLLLCSQTTDENNFDGEQTQMTTSPHTPSERRRCCFRLCASARSRLARDSSRPLPEFNSPRTVEFRAHMVLLGLSWRLVLHARSKHRRDGRTLSQNAIPCVSARGLK